MLANLSLKLDAAMRLGIRNVVAVAKYRSLARRGMIAAKPDEDMGSMAAPSFQTIESDLSLNLSKDMKRLIVDEAEEQLTGTIRGLGGQPFDTGAPPDWHANVLNNVKTSKIEPWFSYSDADPALGDIKGVWEMSRFDWALVFARAYRVSKEKRYLHALNEWLADWTKNNPPYCGRNWMCGQEASIRLLQTLRVADVLEQAGSEKLVSFVEHHINRIAPTISYAIAQDNNHATSEAAALFIGGLWMVRYGPLEKKVKMKRISELGRSHLEHLVRKLILDDGGFAQYSVNYHRVMLMTLCQVEIWRRQWEEPAFSDVFFERASLASRWLGLMTNEKSGASPNFGSNDGANVFRLNSSRYRDFRPACQLAFRLFRQRSFCDAGLWDEDCLWLKVAGTGKIERDYKKERAILLPDSGICRIQSSGGGHEATGFLRIPVDRFRPHQSDALHFDLIDKNGRNLLRDAGTYSYSRVDDLAEFAGTLGHNSITFDDRQPMPRLSRFLFAKWLAGKVSNISANDPRDISITAEYSTAYGCLHRRKISVVEGNWKVEDNISGHQKSARLQWRLPNYEWELSSKLKSSTVQSAGFILEVEGDVPFEAAIIDGWESPTYGVKRSMKIFQVTGNRQNSGFVTQIRLETNS